MADSLGGSLEDDNAAMDGIYNNGRQSSSSSSSLDNGGFLFSLGSFSKMAADSKPKRRSIGRACPESDEIMNLLHGSDPVKVELNRLENEVRGKPDNTHHTTRDCSNVVH
jgi:hypothetical protein